MPIREFLHSKKDKVTHTDYQRNLAVYKTIKVDFDRQRYRARGRDNLIIGNRQENV